MPDNSPTLSLPFLLPSQAQKHVTHNEALSLLDVAVQTAVLDRDRTAAPGSPAVGDCHIVAAGATGDWAGHDGEIAQFDGSLWVYVAAKPGWRAQVLAENTPVVFDGSSWQAQVSVPDVLDNLDGVGVGTSSDGTNRLAVAAAATLLSHEGAGHQVKVNKSAAGDTASLLFQTGWSGRAEMGTAGSDDFEIKVSGDGAIWNTGFSLDAATGQASLPQGVQVDGMVTGLGVQQSATDVTPGRLMRADYGYGPGNLLGVVSQSAGVPTGAVIERGSNANGDYVRFADGTQICWATVTLGFASVSFLNGTWVFPAAFMAPPVVSAMGSHVDASGAATTPSAAQIGTIRHNARFSNSVVFILNRVSSEANFAAQDSFGIVTLAFGHWA